MIYECTRIVGCETFKVGFASKDKAEKWLEDNIEHYRKLKNNNKLFSDVTIRIDCPEDTPQTKGFFITRCKRPFVNLEISTHDLFILRDALDSRLDYLKDWAIPSEIKDSEIIELLALLSTVNKEIEKL